VKILKFRISEIPYHALWGKILQNCDGQKMTYILDENFLKIAHCGLLGFFVLTRCDLNAFLPYKIQITWIFGKFALHIAICIH
jgi:hypothetical protein